MTTVKRYEWEDALVEAQVAGTIKNGALLVAVKLARAINWSPKDGRPSGLYWKNQTAFDAVGVSRSSFYEHRDALFKAGFFKEVKGNLIPTVPSAIQTDESASWTDQSAVRTPESAVRDPFSEDTFSEDALTDEVSSEEVTNPGKPGPVEHFSNQKFDEAFSAIIETVHLDCSGNAVGEHAPVRTADRAAWAEREQTEWLEEAWPSASRAGARGGEEDGTSRD